MICKHKSTKLNSSKYCYVSLTIELNISLLFTYTYMIKNFYFKQFNFAQINKVKQFQELPCITYYSIKPQSLVNIQ